MIDYIFGGLFACWVLFWVIVVPLRTTKLTPTHREIDLFGKRLSWKRRRRSRPYF